MLKVRRLQYEKKKDWKLVMNKGINKENWKNYAENKRRLQCERWENSVRVVNIRIMDESRRKKHVKQRKYKWRKYKNYDPLTTKVNK